MTPIHGTALLLLLMAVITGETAMAEDAIHVRNGNNSAAIRQSGDPADTRRTIESGSGYLRVEQHNGGNSTVIVQQSSPGPMGPVPDDRDEEVMPEPLAGNMPGPRRR